MVQIIVTKPKTINEKGKAQLLKNNVIVIEHPNPDDVRVINNFSGYDTDDLFAALVDAVHEETGTSLKAAIASKLLKAVKSKRPVQPQQPTKP